VEAVGERAHDAGAEQVSHVEDVVVDLVIVGDAGGVLAGEFVTSFGEGLIEVGGHRGAHARIDPSPSPAELSEASQLARAVEAVIATALTPHQRRVALALLVEEVPIDVLADRLGTTRNALYKTLHDARGRLRAALLAAGHLDTIPNRSTP